jgi:hypothetical protein
MTFVPKSRTFSGTVTLRAVPSEAFRLFSPEGERAWVPGWNPDLLFPTGVDWAEGQLFCTREEYGDAIWIVSRLDMSNWNVLYYRVEPGRYVARIEVRVLPYDRVDSQVSIVYSFVGLSEAGNDDIEAMSQSAYDEKMKRWSAWLGTYLESK